MGNTVEQRIVIAAYTREPSPAVVVLQGFVTDNLGNKRLKFLGFPAEAQKVGEKPGDVALRLIRADTELKVSSGRLLMSFQKNGFPVTSFGLEIPNKQDLGPQRKRGDGRFLAWMEMSELIEYMHNKCRRDRIGSGTPETTLALMETLNDRWHLRCSPSDLVKVTSKFVPHDWLSELKNGKPHQARVNNGTSWYEFL